MLTFCRKLKRRKTVQLIKPTFKTKCDVAGCKNLAENIFCDELDTKKKICFCDDCLNLIYSAYSKRVVPKSVESPFKIQKKLR